MLKRALDKKAKQKVKYVLLKAAEEKGIDLNAEMTENINTKLDDLMQAIIDDIGYVKLATMGLGL